MLDSAADCVIGLGANLGDPRSAFRRALGALRLIGEIGAISSLYDTIPVGGPPQPRYLNAAARLRTALSARALLDTLLAIERSQGRERRERWGPRPLDLDILWIAGLSVDEPGLTVPHPRLTERAFALLPLLEVAPDATDPRTGRPLRDRVSALDTSGVARLDEPWGPVGMDTRAPRC
jgi:2-amino-4-hydroxy-6-hydroxymethyldihydropteridine diphosphokinase